MKDVVNNQTMQHKAELVPTMDQPEAVVDDSISQFNASVTVTAVNSTQNPVFQSPPISSPLLRNIASSSSSNPNKNGIKTKVVGSSSSVSRQHHEARLITRSSPPLPSLDEEEMEFFNSFPAGYRFSPTDQELILDYLMKKVHDQPLPRNRIMDVDLYRYNPEFLAAKYALYGENEWYFFTPRLKKYKNGHRPNRAAGDGYWKATGADKPIKRNDVEVGLRKALVFYEGKAPKGEKTNWIMHEYRVSNPPPIRNNTTDANDPNAEDTSMRLDDSVLCRIYKKTEKPHVRFRSNNNRSLFEEDEGNNEDEEEDEVMSEGGYADIKPEYDGYLPDAFDLTYPSPMAEQFDQGPRIMQPHHPFMMQQPPLHNYSFNDFNPMVQMNNYGRRGGGFFNETVNMIRSIPLQMDTITPSFTTFPATSTPQDWYNSVDHYSFPPPPPQHQHQLHHHEINTSDMVSFDRILVSPPPPQNVPESRSFSDQHRPPFGAASQNRPPPRPTKRPCMAAACN